MVTAPEHAIILHTSHPGPVVCQWDPTLQTLINDEHCNKRWTKSTNFDTFKDPWPNSTSPKIWNMELNLNPASHNLASHNVEWKENKSEQFIIIHNNLCFKARRLVCRDDTQFHCTHTQHNTNTQTHFCNSSCILPGNARYVPHYRRDLRRKKKQSWKGHSSWQEKWHKCCLQSRQVRSNSFILGSWA